MANYVYDIEADGLYDTVTKIHCVVFYDLKTKEEFQCTTKSEFLKVLSTAKAIIAHNQIAYDIPVLKKLGWIEDYTVGPDTINGKPINIVDTLILSKLFNVLRKRHGLEWWGEKPEVVDWKGQPIGTYLHRCSKDVKINTTAYYELIEESKGFNWKSAIETEKAFQDIMFKAEVHGVLFDREAAVALLVELNTLMEEIEDEVNKELPMCNLAKSNIKFPPVVRFKKDGSVSAHALRYFEGLLVETDNGCKVNHPNGTTYDLGDTTIPPLVSVKQMTIENQKEIKAHLMADLGWVPTYWNYKKDASGKKIKVKGQLVKTSPRFNDEQSKELCPDLERIGETTPYVKRLCTWLIYRHRRNFIGSPKGAGFLNHERLDVDGRLPGVVDTIGAATHRVQHRVIANLPRVSTPYGKEIRGLFKATPGKVLVGYDASSLEDFVKAHYVYRYDNGDYVRRISQEDYDNHQENADLWNIPRIQAKTGGYALQFECSMPTFCKAVGVDQSTGSLWFDNWWELNYGLKLFRAAAVNYWRTKGKKKFVLGLDGRKIPCNLEHIVVSRIVQSGGAIIMKKATKLMIDSLKRENIHADLLLFMHDELQFECDPKDAPRVEVLGVESIEEASRFYNLKVTITGEAKTGNNLAETH